MRRLKLEKVTGFVALSYLVLIPVGALIVWQKVQYIDQDVSELWEKSEMPLAEPRPAVSISTLKRLVGR